MARIPRLIIEGACYHVIARGNQRQAIFYKDEDFRKYLELLVRYKRKHSAKLYGYCLMNNHIHLLMKIKEASDLAKLLKSVKLSYSFYFRKKYSSSGYVFQGRYKSLLIDNDAYLLDCGRYIERNPLRTKVVDRLEDYRYASFRFYAYGEPNPLLSENILYGQLGSSSKERQIIYRDYVVQPRPYEEIIDREFMLQ